MHDYAIRAWHVHIELCTGGNISLPAESRILLYNAPEIRDIFGPWFQSATAVCKGCKGTLMMPKNLFQLKHA